jgi:hypothetical protein
MQCPLFDPKRKSSSAICCKAVALLNPRLDLHDEPHPLAVAGPIVNHFDDWTDQDLLDLIFLPPRDPGKRNWPASEIPAYDFVSFRLFRFWKGEKKPDSIPMPLPIGIFEWIAPMRSTPESLSCRRNGYPCTEGKCVDSKESLGNWIGRHPICQGPRLRSKRRPATSRRCRATSTSRWARACQSRASPRGRDCSSTAAFRRGRASSRTARPAQSGRW